MGCFAQTRTDEHLVCRTFPKLLPRRPRNLRAPRWSSALAEDARIAGALGTPSSIWYADTQYKCPEANRQSAGRIPSHTVPSTPSVRLGRNSKVNPARPRHSDEVQAIYRFRFSEDFLGRRSQ